MFQINLNFWLLRLKDRVKVNNMYLLRINRPDDSVYCAIMWDRGANGYKFVSLSRNHVCSCVFGTIEEALKLFHDLQKESEVISYDIISKNFNIDKTINNLFE